MVIVALVLQAILWNVPYQYGLSLPMWRALKQVDNSAWRRLVLFFGIWLWGIPCFVYEIAIIRHRFTELSGNSPNNLRWSWCGLLEVYGFFCLFVCLFVCLFPLPPYF